MTDEAWERLRFATIDQMITTTKLRGSCLTLKGHTTPEGWPFVVVVAVARPGNERAVELAEQMGRDLTEAGAAVHRVDKKEWP